MALSVPKLMLSFLERAPFIGHHLKQYRTYRQIPHPAGHYYSVIPDLEELDQHKQRIYGPQGIEDIDLRERAQMDLLNSLVSFYREFPYDFSNPAVVEPGSLRYKKRDAFYRNSDAILLFSMMRHFRPKKIVEIGSGHSSALMLDTAENFLDNEVSFSFIEPYPEERLMQVLRPEDRQRAVVVKSIVQEADPSAYLALGENDFLFVDSSHVSKIGSDVNFIFFNILPRLQPGVLIHFHDIFFPFELPLKWVTGRKWFWNENYILRAFLMNNPDYEIVLFNDLMHKRHGDWFRTHMPQCLIDAENTGSIWIRKLR